MLIEALLVGHIAVLGYWLGSELVINSEFRYVTWASGLPFRERDRLLDHVLDVDQHVRYALILQLGLGLALGALLGYFPGGTGLLATAAMLTVAWLVLVEATHRLRKSPAGRGLAMADSSLRYATVLILLLAGGTALAGRGTLPVWLAIKLALFAGVIACGLGIRWAIVRYYRSWRDLEQAGSTPAIEASLRRRYWQATTILVGLWALIAGIVASSVLKPW